MKPTCFPKLRKVRSPNQVPDLDAKSPSWSGRARTRGIAQAKESSFTAGRSPRLTSGGKAVLLVNERTTRTDPTTKEVIQETPVEVIEAQRGQKWIR